MLRATQLAGFGSKTSTLAVVSFSYLGSLTDGTGSNPFTVTAADLGAADNARAIYVGVNQANNVNVTAVSVAGVSASRVAGPTSASPTPQIWRAEVPTGTSGDIVVTFSGGSPGRSIVGWWRVLNSNSSVYDSDFSASAADPVTNTIDEIGGGAVLGVVRNLTSADNFAWTNLNEDAEPTQGALTVGFASLATATTVAGVTITADGASASRLTTVSIQRA